MANFVLPLWNTDCSPLHIVDRISGRLRGRAVIGDCGLHALITDSSGESPILDGAAASADGTIFAASFAIWDV
jgi:hypothetical protein